VVPGPAGLVLAPFRGVRYAPKRVSGLAEVTSPPYDVIGHEAAQRLLDADPHNVVRLILPREHPGHPGEEYHDAAVLMREWQRAGVLVTDEQPALYVYEQRLAEPGRRDAGNGAGRGGTVIQRGLIGALRLAPPSARIVLPHEDVMPGPVRGRRQLMEAAEANLEPIFLLYDGGPDSAATRLCAEVAAGGTALASAQTSDGIRHTLWAVTDPEALAAIAADLAPRQALIADGNHRYAAYLQMQADRRAPASPARGAPGESPAPGESLWDYGLALLVDATAFPPEIGAIHRVLPGLPPGEAVERAKAGFSVRAITPRPAGGATGRAGGAGPGGDPLPAALAALAAAGRDGPAFLVAGQGQLYLLSDPDPVQLEAAMPPGKSAQWRGLSTAVLQQLLLARLWGVPDDESRVQVVHHDAARAIALADRSPGGTAVLCNPLTAADVYAVAAEGERLPRKSTSFAPKPRTGLVLRSLATS
jgi:uncharacterized protein (DUF1015 family)